MHQQRRRCSLASAASMGKKAKVATVTLSPLLPDFALVVPSVPRTADGAWRFQEIERAIDHIAYQNQAAKEKTR